MHQLKLGAGPATRGAVDPGALLKSWRLGQVLRAQVIDSPARGAALLRIGGQQVSAATDIYLQPGAWLRLQVTGLQPTPTVKILRIPGALPGGENALERRVQALLPRQGSVLRPLLTLLDSPQRVKILSLAGFGDAPQPELVTQLFGELPRSAAALRLALSQSGLFLESRPARHAAAETAAQQPDLKSLLLRLLAGIERARRAPRPHAAARSAALALGALQIELEGALATIELNQLAAIRQSEQAPLQAPLQAPWIWVFHVPFRMRERLHGLALRLRREPPAAAAAEGPEAAREWRALLSVTLPASGQLEVEIFLRGRRVSAVFYCTDERVAARLEPALAQLEAVLLELGFVPAVLRVHRGGRDLPQDEQVWRMRLRRNA